MKKSLEKKENDVKIKVTTYLHGSVKRHFIDDCKSKEVCEAQLAREIFESYYRQRSGNSRSVY